CAYRGPSACGRSAPEAGDEVDVLLLREVARGALEPAPGLVLRSPDEVEETGLLAADVAFRALLVERVQAQQRLVVGAPGQQLRLLRRLFECQPSAGHFATRIQPGP